MTNNSSGSSKTLPPDVHRKAFRKGRRKVFRAVENMETLFEDDWLTIRFRQGRGSGAIVAFGGLRGNLGGVLPRQLVRAGRPSALDRNHLIYVHDKEFSWFTRSGLQDTVLSTVAGTLRRADVRYVNTVGSSMGGYAALLFAERLGALRAIAFGTQYAMDRDVVDDDRMPKFLANIEAGADTRLGTYLTGQTEAYVIQGNHSGDLLHLAAFPSSCGLTSWIVDYPAHTIAAYLETLGLLEDILDCIVGGEIAEADLMLAPHLAQPKAPLEEQVL